MTSINQKFLFLLIFCLYLTFAVSQNSINTTINNSISLSSDTECAKFFGVSECSTCQKTAYRASDKSLSNCFKLQNLTLDDSTESDSALLKSKCDPTCNQTAIKTLNEDIQRESQQDLSEWAQQSDYNNDTKYILPVLWDAVYSAIPNILASCSQASDGFKEYVSSLDKNNFTVQLFPPNGLVSYGNPKETVSLPTNITCSNCYSALAKPWIDFYKMNSSLIPVVQTKLLNRLKEI
ncbi:6453_t:CDS:2 [Ambispora gerdemannii]|uniref:6453_t:CDS:1 n=1 Tax=Ambispora gerdemannii TaxID=144530 RepID=A0A9N9C346_9GLOM|nr:6453_t:CDS:2 [Ambispora gerdemannii]